MTARQVQKQARARWGERATLRENKRALGLREREAAHARLRAIHERIRDIDAELKAMPPNWLASFVSAARFVADVDGQEPSLTGLRTWLVVAERHAELLEERRDLRTEQNGLGGHSKRWSVGVEDGMFRHVRAEADTLDELAAMIENAE